MVRIKTEYCQPLGTTKNAKISGCSWVVVTCKNQTTVALFWEEVLTHLLLSRQVFTCSFQVTYLCLAMLSLKALILWMSGIKSTYSKQRDHTSSGHPHLPITTISGSACLFPSQESVQLQSSQVKHFPQDSINELIIWKMNPLVVPTTSVKFKLAFLHA